MGSPAVGDYAYIKGATASDPAAIYECTTAGTWSDSGRTVDASNVQTFETGQAVNEVKIMDENGEEVGRTANVFSAEAGAAIYDEVVYKDVETVDFSSYTSITGYIYRPDGTWTSNGVIKSYLIPVSDLQADKLVIIGIEDDSSPSIAWLTSNSTSGAAAFVAGTGVEVPGVGSVTEVVIPPTAQYLYVLRSNVVNNVEVSYLPEIKKVSEQTVKEKIAQIKQTLDENLIFTEQLDLTSYQDESGTIIPGGGGFIFASTTNYHKLVPVSDLENKVTIVASTNNSVIAWLTATPTNPVPFCQDYPSRIAIAAGQTMVYDVPEDAVYLYMLSRTASNVGYLPTITVERNRIDKINTDVEHLDERVSQLEEGVATSTSIIKLNDPQKTIQYLRNLTCPNFSSRGYSPGKRPLCILHFSDLHSDAVNLRRIVEYRNAYAEYIDDVIGTGDIIRDEYNQSFNFWSECGADSFLMSTGNHEYYLRTDETGHFYENVTPKQVYDKFFAPYIANWGTVNFPETAATNGQCYYYKDYIVQGIRLIVLDNMANMIPSERDNTGVQAAWLESVLSDARTNNLHVMCAIHIGTTVETLFDTPFSALKNVLNSDGNSQEFLEFYSLRDKVENFIAQGGVFIGWIGGHRHLDSIGMITGYNQMSIHVATASGGMYSNTDTGHGNTDASNNGHSWWLVPRGDDCDREDGTRGQDCFNIISIDPEKMMLRVFKVGSNIDRYGRRKDSLVYNYGTKQLIYSDGCSATQTIQQNS